MDDTRTGPTGARPQGLGVAVVFDWAIAAQLLTQAVAVPLDRLGQSGGAPIVASRVAGAVVMAIGGEALRRGVPVARLAQTALTSLLTVAGILIVARLLTGNGGRGLVLSALVMVTFAPFIAVRLASEQTARWFAAARGHGRAPRLCGGHRIAALVAWSGVWGVAVAWSQAL